ncbi:DNA-binding transcriptional MerR regulator [Nocardia transvalensis]|uniref:DNA-binding transcriptional MerR regulator n=1 Tax=Nocardia transvalensis TaxID=37333 RepID=A0A7W9UGU8_9NOCA|nr:HEAT repeat domain-containing protein [Nocardia transvalensis]MBB5912045.1 DNA-binding transcriptional MerR regulator [Nocardia transvalensis]
MLIGEVARQSGVSARMLRHYDSLGLVRPTGRTVGGYREYSPDDIRRILFVEGLRSVGLSLSQVARALDDPGFTPSALVGDLIRKTEDRLNREQELLDRLRAVDAADPSHWQDVLRIVQLLHGLGSHDAARRQQAVLAPADTAVPAELLAEAVLAESDQNVAGALRWAIARSGTDAVTALAIGLNSEDAEIRRRAVLALAELPGEETTTALTTALEDPDATVRRTAALTLGARGEPRAIPALVATIVQGPNDVEAAELLGALAQDAQWADRIVSALSAEFDTHTADSAIRIRLTQALAELPRPLAVPILRQLATDDDRSVARVASALADVLQPDG